MPAGYANTLMNCSPAWAFLAAVIIGITASVLIANLTARIFKIKEE